MYYCNKCNSIPLLFIIPNLNGSEVLKECLCGKEKLDIVNITKKKNESNSFEHIFKNGELSKEEINILYKDYLIACNKINFVKNLKNQIIEELKEMINKLERLYQKNLEENLKILDLIKSFFMQYDKLKDKNSEKNILLNSNYNIENIIFSKDESILTKYNLLENYLKSFLIINQKPEKNFKFFTLKNIKNLEEEKDWIWCLKELRDGRLCSCSGESIIKIYYKYDFRVQLILKGHEKGIYYIDQLKDGNLISCSDDKTIKIWELNENKYKIILNILCNEKGIRKVIQLKNSLNLISAHEENSINIWKIYDNYSSYELIKKLKKHSSYVFSIIELNNNVLVSGSNDEQLIFWNLTNYQPIKILRNISCCNNNALIKISDNRLVVGGYNLIFIDYINYQIICSIIFFKNLLDSIESILFLKDLNCILIGTQSSKIKKINTINYNIEYVTELNNYNWISSIIQLKNGDIATASYNQIKIWQIKEEKDPQKVNIITPINNFKFKI